MCMTDYDAPSMYCEVLRKARKEHRCGECSRVIAKGEPYQYVTGVWDGDFDTHKTCQHCLVGQSLLRTECKGFVFQMIEEDLREHVSEVLPWSMTAARLVVGMRRQWRRFFGDGLMPVPVAR